MTSTPPNAEAAESAIRQIGAEFRRLRGLRGERIEDISAYLNIKSTHIFGVEQGDLSVITSKREAKSVVRRYADYLGLDGEGIAGPMDPIIASLQGDKAPPKPQPALRFDRTSAIIMASSILLGVTVGWFSIGDVERFDLLTPPVNAGIVDTDEPDPAILEEPALLEELAVPEDDTDVDVAALPDTSSTRSLAAATEPDDDQPITDVAESLSGEAAEASDALLAELKTAIAEEQGAGRVDDAASENAVTENPANVLAAVFAERGEGAHIYEAENTDARVIVRALANVSVQVASRSRDYVWTHTMRPREMLMVPNRNDLELWSGDAAGIEVLLDGTILPPLGPPGTVISGLSLAAASLEVLVEQAAAGGAKPTF